jgi:hypothetical protein
MVQVQCRYFHLTFQRIFSDFPFSRSSRHKTADFDAYVEKGRKKKRKKLAKDYINALLRTALSSVSHIVVVT